MSVEEMFVVTCSWVIGCLIALYKRKVDYWEMESDSEQFDCSWRVHAVIFLASIAGGCVGYRLGELLIFWLASQDSSWDTDGSRLLSAWIVEAVMTFVFFAIALRNQVNRLQRIPLPRAR